MASKTVLVGNLSKDVTENTVMEFFAFCGNIRSMRMEKIEGEVAMQRAVITFEEESAAKTALLLTGAIVAGCSVEVSVYEEVVVGEEVAEAEEEVERGEENVVDDDSSEKEEEKVPKAESRSMMFARLLAEGYSVGDDAVQKVKEFDQRYRISETIVETVQNIDKELHITETLARAGHKIDETLRVRENWAKAGVAASYVATAVTASANQFVDKAKQNENVAKVFDSVSATYESVAATAKEFVADTKTAIDEKKREKRGNMVVPMEDVADQDPENAFEIVDGDVQQNSVENDVHEEDEDELVIRDVDVVSDEDEEVRKKDE